MLDIQIQGPFSFSQTDETSSACRTVVLFTPTEFDIKDSPFSQLDATTQGALKRAVATSRYEGKREQSLVLFSPTLHLDRVILIGCGVETELTAPTMEIAGTQAVKAIEGSSEAHFAFSGNCSAYAASALYGAWLGHYRFDTYRSETPEKNTLLEKLVAGVEDVKLIKAQWARLHAVGQGVYNTRDLVSEPPNILSPSSFAARIEKLRDLGVEVEILKAPALKELGFGALLGVAQGSDQEAHVAIMHYRGCDGAPLAFVGKGVTFDSGGISIKPAAGMDEMKTDMGGAAAVVGTLEAIARRKARAHVVGIVGLVENMLSGNAQRPGDVVRSYSGKTIEVLNTDAEGRLVLADVLAYAQERFAPRLIVDLATLTGAIVVSLGHVRAGLFSTDDRLAQDLYEAGEETGELLWRMPMGDAYDRQLRSDIADLKNITGRPGSAITAAQFLARFVSGTPWAHLDIAGVAWRTEGGPSGLKGATGFGVRLLDALVHRYEKVGPSAA